jgi:hypothetical protein
VDDDRGSSGWFLMKSATLNNSFFLKKKTNGPGWLWETTYRDDFETINCATNMYYFEFGLESVSCYVLE